MILWLTDRTPPERPRRYVSKPNSTIVHPYGSWHERQIRDETQVEYASLAAALAQGRRLCRSCPKD